MGKASITKLIQEAEKQRKDSEDEASKEFERQRKISELFSKGLKAIEIKD